jgi:hypothetical protein
LRGDLARDDDDDDDDDDCSSIATGAANVGAADSDALLLDLSLATLVVELVRPRLLTLLLLLKLLLAAFFLSTDCTAATTCSSLAAKRVGAGAQPK